MEKTSICLTKVVKVFGSDFIIPIHFEVIKSLSLSSILSRNTLSNTEHIVLRTEFSPSNIEEMRKFITDLSVNMQCRSSFVIKPFQIIIPESFPSSKYFFVILPKMDSNLSLIIRSSQELNEDHMGYFLYQLLVHINNLHFFNFSLSGITLLDILINKDCSLKLSSFIFDPYSNLSRIFNNDPSLSDGIDRGRWYSAPEAFISVENLQSDMWKLGCILYEMVTKQVLCPGNNSFDTLRIIIRRVGGIPSEEINKMENEQFKNFAKMIRISSEQSIENMVQGFSEHTADFIKKTIVFDPSKRMKPADALFHPLFSRFFDKSDLAQKYKLSIDEIYEIYEMSYYQLLEKFYDIAAFFT